MTTLNQETALNGKAILQADAIYLLVAAAGGLLTDLLGSFLAMGPQSGLIASAPDTSDLAELFAAHVNDRLNDRATPQRVRDQYFDLAS